MLAIANGCRRVSEPVSQRLCIKTILQGERIDGTNVDIKPERLQKVDGSGYTHRHKKERQAEPDVLLSFIYFAPSLPAQGQPHASHQPSGGHLSTQQVGILFVE